MICQQFKMKTEKKSLHRYKGKVIDLNTKEQELAVMIIANAGDSKSTALEAIEYAREGDLKKADELLKQAKEVLQVGHQAHTDLIVLDANTPVNVSMLLVHASNHLSVAEVTVQFAEIIIGILEEKEK